MENENVGSAPTFATSALCTPDSAKSCDFDRPSRESSHTYMPYMQRARICVHERGEACRKSVQQVASTGTVLYSFVQFRRNIRRTIRRGQFRSASKWDEIRCGSVTRNSRRRTRSFPRGSNVRVSRRNFEMPERTLIIIARFITPRDRNCVARKYRDRNLEAERAAKPSMKPLNAELPNVNHSRRGGGGRDGGRGRGECFYVRHSLAITRATARTRREMS